MNTYWCRSGSIEFWVTEQEWRTVQDFANRVLREAYPTAREIDSWGTDKLPPRFMIERDAVHHNVYWSR